jgi:hypothetical protein
LLSIPAGLAASIARLKIDPVWDPLRNRPDFQQLLLGPEQIGSGTQVGPAAAGTPEPETIPEKRVYEVHPPKDRRGVDLISDALPFVRLW